MLKSKLRNDKTCLNCNYVVQSRFCPNCGQENVETRKTFHHLFIHFFEDLTHYENSFWKTIKNLLFKPGVLTKEYLSGKRLSYLAPVRLYIFVSFITFFLIAILPENKENDFVKINKGSKDKQYYDYNKNDKKEKKIDSLAQLNEDSLYIAEEIADIEKLRKTGILKDKVADSLVKYIKEVGRKDSKNIFLQLDYKSVAEMDSIRKISSSKINDIDYWFHKKTIPLINKYTDDELEKKLLELITRNFPKTLFIYLPLSAFALWLFHNKKRWFYFDHGIFTLHYFSFLLLTFLLLASINCFFGFFENKLLTILNNIVNFVGYSWMIYYFFAARQNFYQEKRLASFLKSAVLIFINIVLITLVLVFFVLYSLVNIN
jgi:hypothetical protein